MRASDISAARCNAATPRLDEAPRAKKRLSEIAFVEASIPASMAAGVEFNSIQGAGSGLHGAIDPIVAPARPDPSVGLRTESKVVAWPPSFFFSNPDAPPYVYIRTWNWY